MGPKRHLRPPEMRFLGCPFVQNAFAVWALPRSPLRELTSLPQTPSWWEGGSLPPPKNPFPAIGHGPWVLWVIEIAAKGSTSKKRLKNTALTSMNVLYIDQELAYAATAPSRRFMFTHQVAAVFCITKWRVMATVLKVWCQIKNRTPSINAYLLEEHSCQILSRSDLKGQEP